MKLILWPLVVWRRRRDVCSRAAGAAWRSGRCLRSGSWAAIGFTGLRRLSGRAPAAPGRRRAGFVHASTSSRSTPARRRPSRARSGSPWGSPFSRAVVVAARRGQERQAFVLAVAAALLLTPIVWLHYFALLARRRRARAAHALARLVRPARHGRHAGERAADAVRDVRDAGDRGRDRGSLAVVAARLDGTADPRGRDVAGRAVTSSAVSRGALDAAAVATVRDRTWAIAVWGAMAVWSAVLFVVVRDGFVGFRVGRFDLGNMVQAVWSTTAGSAARDHARRDGRADGSARRPRRPVPRPARTGMAGLAVTARARTRPDRRRLVGRAARVLARAPSSRLGANGGSPRARLPRLPVARGHRGRVDPSGHVRHPSLSLLHLVPRLGSAGAVRDLRRAGDVDRRAHGPARRRAGDLVRPRARPPRRRGRRSRSRAPRGHSSPCT